MLLTVFFESFKYLVEHKLLLVVSTALYKTRIRVIFSHNYTMCTRFSTLLHALKSVAVHCPLLRNREWHNSVLRGTSQLHVKRLQDLRDSSITRNYDCLYHLVDRLRCKHLCKLYRREIILKKNNATDICYSNNRIHSQKKKGWIAVVLVKQFDLWTFRHKDKAIPYVMYAYESRPYIKGAEICILKYLK